MYRIVFSALVVLALPAWADCENWAAKVVSVEGDVRISHVDPLRSSARQRTTDVAGSADHAGQGQAVCFGQSIQVGEGSRAVLFLSNNTTVQLSANSLLAFPEAQPKDDFLVQLRRGVSYYLSRISHRFVVETPFVNAAVDGTEFLVTAAGGESRVSVMEGDVSVARRGDDWRELMPGEQAVISGQATEEIVVFPVQKGPLVDHAIYYPPLTTLTELSRQGDPALVDAVANLRQRRTDLALSRLAAAPQTAATRTARAAILLAVGEVASAEDLLNQVPDNTPEGAPALALRSIIANTQNRFGEAVPNAQRALQVDPDSAAGWIALSYAWQSVRELESARAAAQEAVSRHPANALAWARLSQMQQVFNATQAARDAAETAVELDPNAVEAVVQLGFVHLFALDIEAATQRFRQALSKAPDHPGAHLGMGLALVRKGNTGRGRRELELATSLDPARSVLRSYLGRIYFEERRDKDAATQWELAKEFDPEDPTPWFYEGVQKLFANDPIGAIESLEASADRNDARGVYRSKALLQSDAATREVTRARAYEDVGYNSGILTAGADALAHDPTSAAGHRLMSDYYSNFGYFDSASADDLLQSKLWQSLSSYPLQPQLSGASLSLIEGQGPQNPGINEYHPLFTQEGLYGSVTGFGGSDSTWGNDLSVSWLGGPVSVNLAQYHYESDMWRDDALLKQDVVNGMVQWQVNPDTRIQAEWVDSTVDNSNLQPSLSESSSGYDLGDKSSNWRFGAWHRLSDSWDLVASWSHLDSDYNEGSMIGDSFDAIFTSSFIRTEVDTLGLQFAGRTQVGNWVVGVEQQQRTADSDIGLSIPGIGVSTLSQTEVNVEHRSLYAYWNRPVSNWLDVFAGIKYLDAEDEYVTDDGFSIEKEDGEDDFWLGKLGFKVALTDQLSLRFAGFQNRVSQLAAGHSLEPTNFNGFSQLYNSGQERYSKEQNLAIALDYDSVILKAGAWFVDRQVDMETGLSYGEQISSLYGYLPLGDRVALSVKANYEDRRYNDADNVSFDTVNIYHLERKTIPVSLHWFMNDKLTLSAEQEYLWEERQVNVGSVSERNEVSVTNLSLNFRLPGRHGYLQLGVDNVWDENEEFLDFGSNRYAFYPTRYFHLTLNLNL